MLTLFTILAAMVTLTTAWPAPQDLGHCYPLSHGHGPSPAIDTPQDFQALDTFRITAEFAGTPNGYVKSFTNLRSTYNEPSMFAGYHEMKTYDVQACADLCDSHETCNAFTMFYERNPVLAPGAACPNPDSTTKIKCDLWTGTITNDMALNYGQYQEKFQVVIAGSNAWVKDIAPIIVPKLHGFTTDVYEAGGAIEAPLDCHGEDTYLGVQKWYDGRLDTKRCAATCVANGRCHFINTFIERHNGVPFAQHCALYTAHWPPRYTTNVGQLWDGQRVINITNSFGFSDANGEHDACEVV